MLGRSWGTCLLTTVARVRCSMSVATGAARAAMHVGVLASTRVPPRRAAHHAATAARSVRVWTRHGFSQATPRVSLAANVLGASLRRHRTVVLRRHASSGSTGSGAAGGARGTPAQAFMSPSSAKATASAEAIAAANAARANVRWWRTVFIRSTTAVTLMSMAGAAGSVAYVWQWEPDASELADAPPGVRLREVVLSDGRKVGIAEYGPEDGRPIFAFHGAGGSRFDIATTQGRGQKAAEEHGVRLVALDRPGFGVSDDAPERTLLDYADDVVQVADALGARQFAVIGFATGGCYAMACAYALPRKYKGRLTGVALVSSDGPYGADDLPDELDNDMTRSYRRYLQRAPWAVTLLMKVLRYVVFSFPDRYVASIRRSFADCDPDKQLLADLPDEIVLRSPKEGLRSGVSGMVRDLQLQYAPAEAWGFSPSDIRLPESAGRVQLWHGQKDPVVPFVWGRYLKQRIPGASEEFPERHGHVSLIHAHFGHVLGRLAHRTPRLGADLRVSEAVVGAI